MGVDQQYPYVVAYGLSRMFRVRCMNVGTYHVEQKVRRATQVTEGGKAAEWKLLAICHNTDPNEAIEVMKADQLEYASGIKAQRVQMAAEKYRAEN